MRKLGLAVLLVATAACGGQESSTTPGIASDTGAPMAPMTSEGAAAEAPTPGTDLSEMAGAAGIAVDPSVQGCLDLVAQQSWTQALTACLTAVERDPQSQEARDALAMAQQQAPAVGAGEAAAALQGAADQKASEAASQLEEATGGLLAPKKP